MQNASAEALANKGIIQGRYVAEEMLIQELHGSPYFRQLTDLHGVESTALEWFDTRLIPDDLKLFFDRLV